MSRLWTTPAGIAGTLLVVLLVLGIFPGGFIGEDIAFVVALAWLGASYKRRFAIACTMVAAFGVAIVVAATQIPIANTFGVGFFAAAGIFLLTLRKVDPSDDLRVLLVTRHDPVTVGGTEVYLRNFLRCVEEPRSQMRVTFCTFDQGVKPKAYCHTSYVARPGGWFFRYTRRNEADVLRLGFWNLIVFGMVSLDLATIAATAADDRQVDVIYGVGGLIATSAAIIAGLLLDRPVVCHFHYDFFFAKYPKALAAFVRGWFGLARGVVANGQGAIEDFAAIGYPRERMRVVHNWVFPQDVLRAPRESVRRTPQEKIALFVGRLVPEKGIELVMQAAPLLPPGIRMVVAGDGPLGDAVKTWSEENPAALWLGEVPNARIGEVLATADCLVWGSIDTYYLSLAAIEALVSGVPVIASKWGTNLFGPQRETLESTLPRTVGILCEPNPRDIAASIEEVCSWDRETVALACREFAAAQYSPKNFEILEGFLRRAAESDAR